MTKKQKIWLGIFMAITLLPEIIYQSTIRLAIGVITIKNITFGESNRLVLFQSVSALITVFLLIIFRKEFVKKWHFWSLLIVFIAWALVAYLSFDLALNGKVEVGGF